MSINGGGGAGIGSSAGFGFGGVISGGPPDPPNDPQPPCQSGCLCEYSDFTLFINTSVPSPRPIYIVGTEWYLFYPNQVEHVIAQAGFTTIPNDNTAGNGIIPECGWQRLQTIRALGVKRGYLGITNQTDGLPISQLGVEDTISTLLRSQYPYVEITLIVTLLVGPIIVIILTVIAVKLSKKLDMKYMRWRQRKLRESQQKPPKPKPKPKPKRPSTDGLKGIKELNRPNNEKSLIIHIPDELQLHIVTYMDYESARSLRSTCKFYSELIDDSILKPLQAQYVEEMIAWERSALATQQSYSYTNVRPTRQFTALYCTYCNRPRPTSTFSVDSQQLDPYSRVCLPCKYAAGEYPEGFATTTAYNALFIHSQPSKEFNFCSVCKNHTNPGYVRTQNSYTCQKCVDMVKYLYLVPYILIPFELMFAIIAWAVECSGNAPSHFWAWETITALFWFTILHLFYLIGLLQALDPTKQGFVYHNTAFAGILALGWIGVAIGMIYEQHVVRPQGFRFYDKHSIAVIPLCIIEGVLFSASCLGQVVVIWRIWKFARSAVTVDTRTLRRMLIDHHDDQRKNNLVASSPAGNLSNV